MAAEMSVVLPDTDFRGKHAAPHGKRVLRWADLCKLYAERASFTEVSALENFCRAANGECTV